MSGCLYEVADRNEAHGSLFNGLFESFAKLPDRFGAIAFQPRIKCGFVLASVIQAFGMEWGQPLACSPAFTHFQKILECVFDTLGIRLVRLVDRGAAAGEDPAHIRHGSICPVAGAVQAVHQDGAGYSQDIPQIPGVRELLRHIGQVGIEFSRMGFVSIQE